MRGVILKMLAEAGVRVADELGPAARSALNRAAINHYALTTDPRPRAFSLWSPIRFPEHDGVKTTPETEDYVTDYTSWPGLVNRKYSGRHLPPAHPTYTAALPPNARYQDGKLGDVTALFARPERMKTSRSSLLFMFFAQWFTDSILRTHPTDRRRNTSNHDIDLCQIYGLTERTTRLLRANTGGRMRTQIIDGEEFLDYLCEPDGQGDFKVRDCYAGLPAGDRDLGSILKGFENLEPNRKEKLYATGLERGNQSVGYVALSTIFVREHNRLADGLARKHPGWSDERLFQTARIINIVLELKLIVHEYINHILGVDLFRLDHRFAEKEHWYRANWMSVEFDLLYRWHALAPDGIEIDGRVVRPKEFRNNNALLEKYGVGGVIDAVSRQRAGAIGLFNTPKYLWDAEYQMIQMGRDFRLQSYNIYRERFGLERLGSFEDLTSDPHVQKELERLYGDIDKVELVVGLFAEEPQAGVLFGDLMSNMVAYDAFTQIFSNPLLSENIYGAHTFSEWGLEQIETTSSLQDLVDRNVGGPGYKVSLGVTLEEPELEIDEALGERRAPDEDDVSHRIAELLRAKLEAKHDASGGAVTRDAHAKSHGCVRATFRVEDGLPERLAQGLFAKAHTYDAWVRFSNGNEDPNRSDAEGDARGMAIKLLEVPGDKVLVGGKHADEQDFVLASHPTFFIDDPGDYLELLGRVQSSHFLTRTVGAAATLGLRGSLVYNAMTSLTIASPLETRYWSATPYRLGVGPGRVAVKYSARPVTPATATIPDDPSPRFLREAMVAALGERDVVFDFLVQVRASDEMSVEETTVEWEEDDAPFEKVATLTIPKQVFATPDRDAIGEGLSFSPWHTRAEHRPLGAVNRVRRIVYEQTSRYRGWVNRRT